MTVDINHVLIFNKLGSVQVLKFMQEALWRMWEGFFFFFFFFFALIRSCYLSPHNTLIAPALHIKIDSMSLSTFESTAESQEGECNH